MHVKHITMSNKITIFMSKWVYPMAFDVFWHFRHFREFLKIHEEFKYETKYLDYFH